MNNKVFLSYSWKDTQIAARLYNDLVRSNVPIWRDQIDGDPTADFQNEFLDKIDECDFFIMLDSSNYRGKSNWCYTEVERCLKNQKERKAPRIIVCLLEKDGPWRTQYKKEQHKLVFEQINRLKYLKLYYDGYDDDCTYDSALNTICEILGVRYEKWDKIPTYQDLEDEIANAAKIKYDEQIANIILAGYRNISNKIEMHYPNVRESFLVWMDDCKNAKTPLFFPRWTYAVWLVNQDKPNLEEARQYFLELTKLFPEDPRGFRGYGNVMAAIGKDFSEIGNVEEASSCYNTSLQYLQKAESLLYEPYNQHQKEICLFGVLTNIGKSLLNMGDYSEALRYNRKALDVMKMQNLFREELVDDTFFIMKKMRYDTLLIIDWIKRLLLKYTLEAILYQLLGLCYHELGDRTRALAELSKAYELCPSEENRQYLNNIKQSLGYL